MIGQGDPRTMRNFLTILFTSAHSLSPPSGGFGGKGIRTPDFQLAKLALYQLSYAPTGSFEFRLPIFDCKEENKSPDVDVIYRASGIFVMAKLRWCASKANRFCSFIVPREVPPNTPLRRL